MCGLDREARACQAGGVENARLMEALLELAETVGLEVRTVREGSEEPAASALCVVRGALWVVLSASDPVEVQLDVLAEALKRQAGDWLDHHYLPPAVRARLAGDGRSS